MDKVSQGREGTVTSLRTNGLAEVCQNSCSIIGKRRDRRSTEDYWYGLDEAAFEFLATVTNTWPGQQRMIEVRSRDDFIQE